MAWKTERYWTSSMIEMDVNKRASVLSCRVSDGARGTALLLEVKKSLLAPVSMIIFGYGSLRDAESFSSVDGRADYGEIVEYGDIPLFVRFRFQQPIPVVEPRLGGVAFENNITPIKAPEELNTVLYKSQSLISVILHPRRGGRFIPTRIEIETSE